MIPLDRDLLRAGYLTAPDGHIRHIIGLERLAQHADAAGVTLWWHCGVCRKPSWLLPESRRIVLAPWLFYAAPFWVRDCISHELAHATVGLDCDRARRYQTRCYGDLVMPVWMA